ncbi:MAG: rRNA maturation RNase YbeY [bacterium]|nr:rRNA maturation RNase YbeY [bacterium]
MTTINIFTENIFSNWKPDEKKIIKNTRKLLRYYLQELSAKSCLNGYKYNSLTLDILFTDSNKTHELNRDYRDKDKPADIITFAIFADDENRFVFDNDINLGEIVIAMDKVEDLTNKDVSFAKNREQELYFLISHGLMHLLGFDHRDEEEYNFVIGEQRKALEQINYDKI